jgi:SPOR domain
MKYILSTCLLLFIASLSWAQKGSLSEDPIITKMMAQFAETNKSKRTVEGWRIQIASTTDRRQMEEALHNFEGKYPTVPVNWVHAKPYYQLRVGAFTSKMESLRLLSFIKTDYPSAYPAQDNAIRPAELAGIKVK